MKDTAPGTTTDPPMKLKTEEDPPTEPKSDERPDTVVSLAPEKGQEQLHHYGLVVTGEEALVADPQTSSRGQHGMRCAGGTRGQSQAKGHCIDLLSNLIRAKIALV